MNTIKSTAIYVYSWVKKVVAPLLQNAKTANNSNNDHYSSYMMRIKVKKSSDALFWYTQHIGEIFEVMATDIDRYWVRELDEYHCLNFILKVDCEVFVQD